MVWPFSPRSTPRLGFARVHGRSMLPALREGDRLLVRYGAAVRPGRLVVARMPDGVVVVKRVEGRRPAGWWLLSDNPNEGVDSRHRGPVADDRILAVGVMRVWPPVRRPLGRPRSGRIIRGGPPA